MLLSLLVLATKKFKSFSTLLQLITIIVIATGAYIAADQVYLQYFLTDTSNNNAACGAINNKFYLMLPNQSPEQSIVALIFLKKYLALV